MNTIQYKTIDNNKAALYKKYSDLSNKNKESNNKYYSEISSNSIVYKSDNVIMPKPTHSFVSPNELYKDTKFKRDHSIDKKIENSMGKFQNMEPDSPLLYAINNFSRPTDSTNLIKSTKISSIKIDDNMDIASIHSMMGSSITEKITPTQLNTIQGTYNDNYSNFSYKDQAIYSSIDCNKLYR